MSLLYEVLEPLTDAMSALRRARELLDGFAEWADDPFSPEMGPVVTVEQFHHARHCFTRGAFVCRDGSRFPPDGPDGFWRVVTRTGALRGGDPYRGPGPGP
jgi:hypothetical protein